MFFRQFFIEGLGCCSYLVGCPAVGECAVVDPKRDIGEYLSAAREEGLRITHVLETHVHADHVSGNQALVAQTGAKVYIHHNAGVEYPHIPLREGDEHHLGSVLIRALESPGHTPDSISFLVSDKLRAEAPWFLLTGDTLLVGDAGRPDLRGEDVLLRQVENLYETLYGKFSRLDPALEIFPAHGSGSLCGRGLSSKLSSTLGYERLANPHLRCSSREEFLTAMTTGLPLRPKNFSRMIELNRKGPAPLDLSRPLSPLSPEEVLEAQRGGCLLLDTRSARAFSKGYIPGAINVGLAPQFPNWAGAALDPAPELVLIGERKEDLEEARLGLHRVGYDGIRGYLKGGFRAWRRKGLPVSCLKELSPKQLYQRLKGRAPLGGDGGLLDIRTPSEWEEGRILGAVHRPISELLALGFEGLEREGLFLICGSGYRSSLLGSLMMAQGFQGLTHLAGGMAAWNGAGLPTVR